MIVEECPWQKITVRIQFEDTTINMDACDPRLAFIDPVQIILYMNRLVDGSEQSCNSNTRGANMDPIIPDIIFKVATKKATDWNRREATDKTIDHTEKTSTMGRILWAVLDLGQLLT